MKFLKAALLISVAALYSVLGTPAFSQDTGFGKNKVQYRQFEWSYIQTNNFDIYYYPGGYELAKFAAGVLEEDRKSTRLNSSHIQKSRMPSSA